MKCPKCGGNVNAGDKFCLNCGAELKYTRKRNFKMILIIGVLVIAAGIAVLSDDIGRLFDRADNANAYVYYSDGQYELLTNLLKNKSICFSYGIDDSYHIPYMVKFSPDGKYIYYYSQYNEKSDKGTLCRAEWSRLGQNAARNEKYIDFIDTNVWLSFRFVKDNCILYRNDQNDLFYYDGNESIRIAKSVESYMTDGDKRVIYKTSDNGSSDYRLYGINLDEPEEKKKLASDVSYIENYDDFDNIFYSKSTSEDDSDLYVVGFDKERECIGKQVSNIYSDNGETYFTVNNGNSVSLYDYVDDTQSEMDTGEPEEVYVPLSWECYEDDYDEIYTSCSQPCTFLQNASQTSIEGQPEDEFVQFTGKYKDLENEQGYFLVTDEIKESLMELAEIYGDGYPDEWLEFCFAKETDEDSDDEETNTLEYLREQLKSTDHNYPLCDLCHYKDGKVTTISRDIIAIENYSNCFSYATKDMITDKIKLEDISECDDVLVLFKVKFGEQSCLIPYDANSATVYFSQESAEYLDQSNGINVYLVGQNLYVLDSERTLSMATVKDSTVGKFSKIADDAIYFGRDSTTYCYGIEKDESLSNYDLYFCTAGKSILKAEDIEVDDLDVYDDMFLAAVWNNDYSSYELSMVTENGDNIIIADDVTEHARIDADNILYISDGSLYVYNGKERQLLDMDAGHFWTKDTVKTSLNKDGDY